MFLVGRLLGWGGYCDALFAWHFGDFAMVVSFALWVCLFLLFWVWFLSCFDSCGPVVFLVLLSFSLVCFD